MEDIWDDMEFTGTESLGVSGIEAEKDTEGVLSQCVCPGERDSERTFSIPEGSIEGLSLSFFEAALIGEVDSSCGMDNVSVVSYRKILSLSRRNLRLSL